MTAAAGKITRSTEPRGEFLLDVDAPAVYGSVSSTVPAMSKDARLATVDSAYTGVGDPRVTFDGENLLTVKTYKFIGSRPPAGSRVVLEPMSNTWIITGSFTPGNSITKSTKIFTKGATALNTPTTVANYIVASIDVPYPGWTYVVAAMGQCYYHTTNVVYDLRCLLDDTNTTFSRQGWGPDSTIGGAGLQITAFPAVGLTTPFNEAHSFKLRLDRIAGTGTLDYVSDDAFGGITIWVIPA